MLSIYNLAKKFGLSCLCFPHNKLSGKNYYCRMPCSPCEVTTRAFHYSPPFPSVLNGLAGGITYARHTVPEKWHIQRAKQRGKGQMEKRKIFHFFPLLRFI